MPADRFRALNDAELDALSDEQLFEYFLDARDAGDPSATTALQVLAYGYWNRLYRRALVNVPPGDVEDVVGCAVKGAVKSALSAPLQGRAIGQFRAWLYNILSRQIANYHRRKSLDTIPLFSEHDDDELVWGAEPIVEDDLPGEIDRRDAVARVIAGLSEPHAMAVELSFFEDLPTATVAELVNRRFGETQNTPMTEDNIYKIRERFRAALRSELPDSPFEL